MKMGRNKVTAKQKKFAGDTCLGFKFSLLSYNDNNNNYMLPTSEYCNMHAYIYIYISLMALAPDLFGLSLSKPNLFQTNKQGL